MLSMSMTGQLLFTFWLSSSWTWFELDFFYLNVQSELSPLLSDKFNSYKRMLRLIYFYFFFREKLNFIHLLLDCEYECSNSILPHHYYSHNHLCIYCGAPLCTYSIYGWQLVFLFFSFLLFLLVVSFVLFGNHIYLSLSYFIKKLRTLPCPKNYANGKISLKHNVYPFPLFFRELLFGQETCCCKLDWGARKVSCLWSNY